MRIGILQAGHVPEAQRPVHGDYDAMFERLLAGRGLDFAAWDVEGMAFPEAPEVCDGWLVTGSRHGVYEDHPFIPPLEDFVRACVAADRPVVGICFGHQIVAQALGGRVEKFAGGWSVGRRSYDAPGGPLALNAWHQDQVVEAPEGAVAVASNDHCHNAVLAYDRRAWTIQPHPEFSDALVADFVAARQGTGTYPEALMERAARDAARGAPADAGRVADAIARFLHDRDALHALR